MQKYILLIITTILLVNEVITFHIRKNAYAIDKRDLDDLLYNVYNYQRRLDELDGTLNLQKMLNVYKK